LRNVEKHYLNELGLSDSVMEEGCRVLLESKERRLPRNFEFQERWMGDELQRARHQQRLTRRWLQRTIATCMSMGSLCGLSMVPGMETGRSAGVRFRTCLSTLERHTASRPKINSPAIPGTINSLVRDLSSLTYSSLYVHPCTTVVVGRGSAHRLVLGTVVF
jgi:hypothetical protein